MLRSRSSHAAASPASPPPTMAASYCAFCKAMVGNADLPAAWRACDQPDEREVLFGHLPNLKVISFAGTGVWDRVDVAYATRRGIAVCNVPAWGNDTIAEFTFALLLALARKLFAADAVARRPEWKVEECYGVQLRGK